MYYHHLESKNNNVKHVKLELRRRTRFKDLGFSINFH